MSEAQGVWVAYFHDMNTIATAVFAEEIEALRFANTSGYHHVAFWPFGMELADALKERP